MVHHIHGVIEERADVLYSTIHTLPQTTITIVGVLLHVYTYVCIWAKTGEYLAVFLAFVDL